MIDISKKIQLLQLIDQSFLFSSGQLLPSPKGKTEMERLEWLSNDAPYAILAQNNIEFPNFIYVNKFAITCFKYTEDEMLSLHAYLSAAPDAQEERNKILKQVQENNIAFNYSGIRLTKFNEPFTIDDGIIWKIFENGNHGEVIGKAALFWLKDEPKPDWWEILK